MTTRRVVLCADDYGLTEGVSRGILELAGAGRLSATGAMANMPPWPRLAPELRSLGEGFGIGLHLNLTTGAPLGAMRGLCPSGTLPSLRALLVRALAGRLPVAEVEAEIGRQLDAFEQAHGASPAFVDGHQHVHVLPGVRQALLRVLKGRGYAGRLWLRDPSDPASALARRGLSAPKALVVAGLAGGFRRAARAAGFDTNEGFSGFSPFDPALDPARVFERAFLDLGPRPVVMCHPGNPDEALRALDPAVESRSAELAYLRSPAFGDLLAERGLVLVPRP